MSMEIKSLEELRPEDAAVFQQKVISHAELAPVVAERTRSTFDRLREPATAGLARLATVAA
jgi:hypothetical protein